MAVPGPDEYSGKAGERKYDLALNYRNCYDIKVDPSGNVYEVGPTGERLYG
jgi:hypothetical protein